jgi:hypothetical protein
VWRRDGPPPGRVLRELTAAGAVDPDAAWRRDDGHVEAPLAFATPLGDSLTATLALLAEAALVVVLWFAIFYLGVAASVFAWRHPAATPMTTWRELPAVLRFERLDRYQLPVK